MTPLTHKDVVLGLSVLSLITEKATHLWFDLNVVTLIADMDGVFGLLRCGAASTQVCEFSTASLSCSYLLYRGTGDGQRWSVTRRRDELRL